MTALSHIARANVDGARGLFAAVLGADPSQMTAAQQDLVRRIDAYGGADSTTLDLALDQIDAPEADKRAVASWYGVDLATKETA